MTICKCTSNSKQFNISKYMFLEEIFGSSESSVCNLLYGRTHTCCIQKTGFFNNYSKSIVNVKEGGDYIPAIIQDDIYACECSLLSDYYFMWPTL